jgi:hypothetical protein
VSTADHVLGNRVGGEGLRTGTTYGLLLLSLPFAILVDIEEVVARADRQFKLRPRGEERLVEFAKSLHNLDSLRQTTCQR